LKEFVDRIYKVLSKEEQLKHTISIIDIRSKHKILCDSRILNHSMSSVSLATTAAGMGTAAAALAGVSVIPIVGWTIAGLTLGSIAATIAVD
jgi:hypothetical protein